MPIRTQEQALRVYYATMPDAELQTAAANRVSFLPIAQRLLSEELQRRNLAAEPPAAPGRPKDRHGVGWALRHAFRH